MTMLSKKLCLLLISSTLFLGMQGMEHDDLSDEEVLPDRRGKQEVNLKELALKMLKETLDKGLKDVDGRSGEELLAMVVEYFLEEPLQDANNLNRSDLEEKIIPFTPFILTRIEPIYRNLTLASKKILPELLSAAVNIVNKKITASKDKKEKENLQKLLDAAKPVIEFVHNNNNAGIVAQFSLLDPSGKIIVGFLLPVAFYGGYKAVQAMMHKDEFQEELR